MVIQTEPGDTNVNTDDGKWNTRNICLFIYMKFRIGPWAWLYWLKTFENIHLLQLFTEPIFDKDLKMLD